MFFKKDYAETFGKKVLSHIIFGDNDTIKNLEFDIEKIRKAKRRGEFSNLWMNTVISGGQIQMQSQYGDNIDRDSRFLDDPAYSRKGVGIEIKTHLNDRIKIAIWKSGSIVICKSYDTFQDNVLLYFLLVEKFLRYSNFSII